jgi:hypothetical protein
MAVSAPERRFLLSQINKLAEAELNQLWGQAERLSDVDFFGFIVQAYPIVVDPYVDMAANLAATWFELSDPTSRYRAVTAPPPPVEKLAKNAEWALKSLGDQGRVNLEGSLNRSVFDGARDTTRINVERTGSRWAIDARPTACPWCRMMATRGAVYRKKATALAACHDNGHCVAIEDRTGDYEPPAHIEKWEDEYDKARANAGSGDPKQIQAAWRQLLAAE